MSMSSTGDSRYTNPVRLAVATREVTSQPVNASAGPSNYTETETLLRAKKRNDEIRRKGDKWADKLMEETVDRETFKRALRYIHPSQYELITHERHLNSLCSYPLCARPPAAPFKPGKRFRISTTNRSITEVEGNKEDGYCCKACAVRSRWVYDRLGEAGSVLARGKDWTIELVEDLDLPSRGDSGSPRATEGTASASRHETGDAKAASHTRHAAEPAGSLPAARRNKSDPPAKAEVAVPEDLMGDLQIHERPTSSTATPPSLIPTSPPPSNPSTKPTTLTPSKRAPNAILGEQSKLAQTVLKASKAINPEPQVNPDSEDEGEHAEVEWEREVGLDWGGGSEGEEDVWEAMKEAREMAEAADAHGR